MSQPTLSLKFAFWRQLSSEFQSSLCYSKVKFDIENIYLSEDITCEMTLSSTDSLLILKMVKSNSRSDYIISLIESLETMSSLLDSRSLFWSSSSSLLLKLNSLWCIISLSLPQLIDTSTLDMPEVNLAAMLKILPFIFFLFLQTDLGKKPTSACIAKGIMSPRSVSSTSIMITLLHLTSIIWLMIKMTSRSLSLCWFYWRSYSSVAMMSQIWTLSLCKYLKIQL